MVRERDYSICGGKFQQLCLTVAEWRAGKGFETHWKNVPEKLALTCGELVGEALEAYRHLNDRTLNFCGHDGGYSGGIEEAQKPVLANFREELADALIRLMDLAGSLGIDLEEEMIRKMHKNEKRPYKHGKEL